MYFLKAQFFVGVILEIYFFEKTFSKMYFLREQFRKWIVREQFWKCIFWGRKSWKYFLKKILKLAADWNEWYFLINYNRFTVLNCLFANLLTTNKNVVGRGISLGYFTPLGKSSASLGRVGWEVLGDHWRDMASRKSHKYCTVSGRVAKESWLPVFRKEGELIIEQPVLIGA